MEAVKVNIRRSHKGESTLVSVMAYRYDIQTIPIILYESVHTPGKYMCAEYHTGRKLCDPQATMQDALNTTTTRINEVGVEKAFKEAKIKIMDEGYANPPDKCLWCGSPHVGGPEECKE